jgi:hypothetical protein
MKLNDKIKDRKIAYLFRKGPALSFEIALLYFISAKRKSAGPKIEDACLRAAHWLKKAGIECPACIKLEEIEKILVANKHLIKAERPFFSSQPIRVNRILVCG